MRVWPGQPYPLGATWDGEGVNFAIFSENATGVELCFFNHEDDAIESAKIQLRELTDQVWLLIDRTTRQLGLVLDPNQPLPSI